MKNSDKFWIISFALGFLLSFTVVGVPAGIGLFVFMNALLASIIYYGKNNREAKELEETRESNGLLWIISGFYILLTVPYLYRIAPEIVGTLVGTHITIIFLGAWYYALPAVMHIVDFFMFIFSPVVAGITWISESFKSIIGLFKDNANIVKTILKVIMYSALSLAVFILFAKFLSEADPEFKERINKIIESLQLSEVAGRTALGVLMTFVVAGLLRVIGFSKILPIFGTKVERAKERWEKAFALVMSRKSDALLPVIVTVPIALLFSIYVWVQFKYLFGHDVAEILSKYSFAEYAHRGFIELLTVGVLTYPILSWSMNQSKNEWKLPRFLAFFVNTGIVGLLVTMLYSMVLRMNIYMGTYGPSVLRMYVIIGAVFVAIALLMYEIAAIFRVVTPGYRLFKGRIFGDYTIIALIVGLGLLSTVSIVPWSRVAVTQIEAYYNETGNVDIFQLTDLSAEAQPDLYAFGATLKDKGVNDGGMALQAYSSMIRENYVESRKSSLFTNLFGFNFGGYRIMTQIPESPKREIEAEYKEYIQDRVDEITKDYWVAIRDNKFEEARALFDPKMESNDITGFSGDVEVEISQLGTLSTYEIYSFSEGGSKSLNLSSRIQLLREVTDEVKTKDGVKTVTSIEGDLQYFTLKFGFRNGKLNMTSSDLVLMYLPDAIGKETTYSSDFYSYGYYTYCDIPTLEYIYSNSPCDNVDEAMVRSVKPIMIDDFDQSGEQRMGGFYKSDFVTEADQQVEDNVLDGDVAL